MLLYNYTKKWLLIASLLLASAQLKVVAAPDLTSLLAIIEPLQEGSWVKVNLNQFSDVWTPAELRPLYGVSNPTPRSIIGAWSSFAWDSNRGDLIIYGGGHANYGGNDVYRWRGTTRQWERASLPSEITQDSLGNWIAIDGVDAAPISAHTYDNQLFLPIIDRFITFGGAAFNNGDAYLRQISPFSAIRTGPYLFDPNKADGDKVGGTTGSHVQREQSFPSVIGGQMWQNRDIYQNIPGNPPLPFSFVNSTSAYTQENGKDVVYITARPGGGTASYLYKYTINDVNNPSLDQWALMGIYWSGIGGQGAGLYDPILNIYIRSGVSTFTFWDIAKAGNDNRNQPVNFTDLSGQFSVNPDYGMDYDSNRHQYLLWEGYSDVWALLPPTTASSDGWYIVKLPASQTAGPTLGPGVGILGKWKYIAQLDVFMGLQGSVVGDVWLYKPIGWEHPQLGPRALKPTIAPDSGDYSSPITVTMSTRQQQGVIYYTTNGVEPTIQSNIYTGPFSVAQAMTIKAMTVAPGVRNSRVTTVIYGGGGANPPSGETNQAPIINQVTISADPISDEQNTIITVLATDSDGPQPLSYQWQQVLGNGQITPISTTQIQYTPNDVTVTEQHQLRLEIFDGINTVSQLVEIIVTDANAPPPLYFNNFANSNLTDWQIVDQGSEQAPSNWLIEQGQLKQLSNIWSQPNDDGSFPNKLGTYLQYLLGTGWQNVVIDVDIQSLDDDAVGIMFRHDSAGNYYRFSWDQSRGYRRLVKYYNGSFTVLAEDQVPYITGQSYHLTVQADGNQLTVLVDQQPIFAVADNNNPLLQGTLSLYSWGNEGSIFDNLQVNGLEGQPQSPIINQLQVSANQINDQQQTQLAVEIFDPDTPIESLIVEWQIITGGGQLSNISGLQTIYTPNDVSNTEQHTLQVTVSDGIHYVSQQVIITVTDTESQEIPAALLDESFTSFDFANWEIVTEGTIQAPSQWEIQQNKLVQFSNVYSMPFEVADPAKLGTYIQYLPGNEWSDYQIEMKLRSIDDDQIGMMFRVVDNRHYYRFGWNSSGNRRQLVKRVGNDFIVLAEDNVGYQSWAVYSLKIMAKGNQLSVFINNQLIFDVTDNSYLQGTIALYSWANIGSEFSELLVTDLSAGIKPPQVIAEQGLPAVINENSQVNLAVTVDNEPAPTTQYNWQLIGPGQLTTTTTAVTSYQVAAVAKATPVKIVNKITNNNLNTQQIFYGTVVNSQLPKQVMDESFAQWNEAFWQVVTDGNISAPAHWYISGGMLVENSNVFALPTDATDITKKGSYLVYQPGLQWQNYQFNCLIRSDDDDAVGVAFRYQDHQHYYRFSWDKQRQYRRLVKRVGDSYTLLAEDHIAYQQGKSYQLKIVANGNTLQVVVDGETIFNVVDHSLSHGTIAPYSWGSNGSRFDNFVVDLLP
ncbi:chitobiase/beta-hexosaminidase C-terminal domain-containing protein [Spartinivicinus ruber]|uniref:chitobiase/beta-hexosaminidase C-terminal domain-containing protein n=1 Tax=Spartinivicinus ruber TaxID=2683272 RepID=UPI0013D61279|nr:chitobiase/beta-hexosaminidase C-terminal domain-containing protein [Spartinivicinus ruber]